MRIKKEYIALFAVILALALYLVFRTTDRTHYELPSLREIDPGEISKLEVAKPDGSIVLTREGDEWRISPHGYPADTTTVDRMLGTLGQITLTTLVSESKTYERYGLDDKSRITVKAWSQGNLSRELAIGEAAAASRHTFVTIAGDDRVYHARGRIREQFDQTVDGLRDKTVLAFEQNEIRRIELTKDGQKTVFVRKEVPVERSSSPEAEDRRSTESEAEFVWKTADGEKGDESELNSLIGTLADLRCEQYLEDREKGDLQDPIYNILLKGSHEYRLSIFAKTKEDAEGYPAISSESAYAFLLTDRQAENMMKDPGEMVVTPEGS